MSFINGGADNPRAVIRRYWNWLIESPAAAPPPSPPSTTFVAARGGGQVGGKHSVDGLTWTKFSFPGSAAIGGLAQNASGFLALPYNGTGTFTSTDGITWAAGGALPTIANWGGAVWNGSQWLAFGEFTGNSKMATSPDGLIWTASGALTQPGFVIWDGSRYVALIGNAPYIYTSLDGAAWSAVATNIDAFTDAITPGRIHFFNGTYYMSGSGFDDVSFNSFWMLASSDLITWSNVLNDSGAGEPQTSSEFADDGVSTIVCTSLSNDRVYVKVGAGAWSQVNLTATPLFFTGGDIAFKQSLFALVSNWGTTYSSADGLTWAFVAPVGATSTWTSVV